MLSLFITKPTVLVDEKKVRRNIKKMNDKAHANRVKFRPHFKTHQSAEIGEWFKEMGIKCITVSSQEMAAYFARNGWDDITVAFNVNVLEIDRICALSKRIKLTLLVDNLETVSALKNKLERPHDLFIKVDTGYGRTGIPWLKRDKVLSLAKKIKEYSAFNFVGLLTHAGHSYKTDQPEKTLQVHEESISRLNFLKKYLMNSGFNPCLLSIGDTPCCSIANNFKDVDEIRPGNFVFYDLIQNQIGSCRTDEIAVTVACPVVGRYPDRDQLVIYGGGIHLSKEFILNAQGNRVFGYLTPMKNGKWGQLNENVFISSVSQEHGVVNAPRSFIKKTQIGDILLFFPVHSCLLGPLNGYYLTLKGKKIKCMSE
jgi:D-serine deaminase-like pyridoxal phosphate-dependent protein